jgi:hypothetical protein
MDWQKNRLFIAAAALLVLGGLATYMVRSRTGDTTTGGPAERPTLPTIDRDDVTALEFTRPPPGGEGEAEHVRLELHDGTWHVTEPLAAVADQSAVDTALEKLGDLEVAGTAATHAEHHEELEVDDAHGVHVVVHGAGDEVLADLIVGAFRGGSTMVRASGQDTVVTVHGSIRFAFARDLKDWRDRSMLDLEAGEVRVARWTGPNGSFAFERPTVAAEAPPPPTDAEDDEPAPAPTTTLGDWAPTAVSYVPAVEGDAGVAAAPPAPSTTLANFAASRVTSIVSSLAHLRASDFAAAGIDRAGAGITDASAHVTLTTGVGAAAQDHTVWVGNEAESGTFYAMRDDDPTVFVVSRFLMEKISPAASAFEQSPTAAAEEAPSMPDMGALGGAGGEIPPELLQQIQAQIAAQGGMH